nr:hypothetical protein [Tanacetum cinerariifolium]
LTDMVDEVAHALKLL